MFVAILMLIEGLMFIGRYESRASQSFRALSINWLHLRSRDRNFCFKEDLSIYHFRVFSFQFLRAKII